MKKTISISMLVLSLLSVAPIGAYAKENISKGDKNEKNEIHTEIKQEKGFWNMFRRFSNKDNKSKNIFRISEPKIVEATSTASIVWTTNISTIGYIKFNTDKNLVASSTKISENTSDFGHKISLSGLTPDTVYYYTVGGTDSQGNTIESKINHFKTKKVQSVDTSIPNILFSGTLKVGTTTANILWVTDKPTTGKVWTSTTSPVSVSGALTIVSSGSSYFHNVSLAGLVASTTYFYSISSLDAVGNTVSANGSFVTLAQ